MKNRLRFGLRACIAASALAISVSVQADVWYVDASAPSSGQTGTSWDHPYLTIQQAVADADSGDEIRVAGGTYKPANQSTPIDLDSGVNIKGGYVGYPLSGSSNDRTEESILSGDLSNNDPVFTDNATRVVRILAAHNRRARVLRIPPIAPTLTALPFEMRTQLRA